MISSASSSPPNGLKYLLFITCRYSKLVKVAPLQRITAWELARAFGIHWAFCHGPPKILLADIGRQMTAKFLTHVCQILGVKNVFTATCHPRTNGQNERLNRTILASLRHYVADHRKEWDLYAETVALAYNT